MIERIDGYIIKDGCYLVPIQPLQTAADASELAYKILRDNLEKYQKRNPLLLPVMRGGAGIFLPVSGILRYFLRNDEEPQDIDYIPIKVSRYKKGGINKEGEIRIDEADIVQALAAMYGHDEAILIDDVFDKGTTLKSIRERLSVAEKKILIATAHVKPEHNQTDIAPDYFVGAYYDKTIGGIRRPPWLVYHWESDDHQPEVWNEMFPDLAKVSRSALLEQASLARDGIVNLTEDE